MANTYIYPVYDAEKPNVIKIKKVIASSWKSALEKVMQIYCDKYDDLTDDNWNVFTRQLYDLYDIVIGEVVDIESLT